MGRTKAFPMISLVLHHRHARRQIIRPSGIPCLGLDAPLPVKSILDCCTGNVEFPALILLFLRRCILAASFLVLMCSGLTASASPSGAVPYRPNAEETALLKRAEETLGTVRTMQARFLQISSDGSSSEGTVSIQRPGKMSLTYDPPSKIKVVADGTWLVFIDNEVGQVSNLPLDSTPAGILLRKNPRFSDPDIVLKDIRRAAGVAEIELVMADDPAAGSLMLVFTEHPFELRQWRVRDARDLETAVSLFSVRTGLSFDQGLFSWSNLPARYR